MAVGDTQQDSRQSQSVKPAADLGLASPEASRLRAEPTPCSARSRAARPRAQWAPGGALPSVCSWPGAAPSCSGRWGLSEANGENHQPCVLGMCSNHTPAFCGSSANNSGRIQGGPTGWPGAGLLGEGVHGGLNGFPRRAGRWGVCPQDRPAVVRRGRASPGDSSPKPTRRAETVNLRPGPRGQRSEP